MELGSCDKQVSDRVSGCDSVQQGHSLSSTIVIWSRRMRQTFQVYGTE
jgi:hypothetical protein